MQYFTEVPSNKFCESWQAVTREFEVRVRLSFPSFTIPLDYLEPLSPSTPTVMSTSDSDSVFSDSDSVISDSETATSSDSTFILTPDGSEYTPESSLLLSSIVEVTAPSSPSSFGSHDSDGDESDDEGEGDAEEEWQESLKQLELLASMVVIPFVGKWIGRKCAYIGRSRVT